MRSLASVSATTGRAMRRAISEPARAARPTASAAARIQATAALTSASRPDAGPSDSFT